MTVSHHLAATRVVAQMGVGLDEPLNFVFQGRSKHPCGPLPNEFVELAADLACGVTSCYLLFHGVSFLPVWAVLGNFFNREDTPPSFPSVEHKIQLYLDNLDDRALSHIRMDMSKSEVRSLLGTPTSVTELAEGRELWSYMYRIEEGEAGPRYVPIPPGGKGPPEGSVTIVFFSSGGVAFVDRN